MATYTPTATPTPEFTPTPSPSPTPEFAQATAKNNANVRSGPVDRHTRGSASSRRARPTRSPGRTTTAPGGSSTLNGKPGWVSADLVTVTRQRRRRGSRRSCATAHRSAGCRRSGRAAAAAAPAKSYPAAPGAFGYGVQIDPYGDRAEAIALTKAMGFNWIKFQLPWKDFEGSPGRAQLPGRRRQRTERGRAQGAAERGQGAELGATRQLRLLGRRTAGQPPDLRRLRRCAGSHITRARCQAIEVWNEQNLWYEWGHEPLDPNRYVDLLCRAYSAIKAADPSITVVSGALTPTGLNDGSTAIDDLAYLQRMYAAGAKRCFDAVGAHPSGYNNPPDAKFGYSNPAEPSFKNHPSFFFRDTMERYRGVMVANGDARQAHLADRVRLGLDGSPVGGYEYARDISEDEQAQYIVARLPDDEGLGLGGPGVPVEPQLQRDQPGSELAAFGIQGRPAYGALQAMPK